MFQLQENRPLEKQKAIYDEFLNAPVENRFLFGANTISASVAEQVDCNAIIDDYVEHENFAGLPVFRSDVLTSNAVVLNCVIYARPITARDFLSSKGIKNIDYYAFHDWDINTNARTSLIEYQRLQAAKSDLIANQAKYGKLYAQFSDDISRNTLLKLLNFRMTNDLTFMEGFTNRQEEQYFDAVVKFEPGTEVFADIGGFDGATTLEFARRCPDYMGAHVFEPDERNQEVLKRNLSGLKNIHIHQQGLSDRAEILSFTSDGSSSHLSEDGDLQIKVGPLDEVVDEAVTFLKMDIEGAEKAAISGARETIQKHHPKMAICVYHLADDYWKIPELVFSIRPDYEIYLRHYTEGMTETVMYFIPK